MLLTVYLLLLVGLQIGMLLVEALSLISNLLTLLLIYLLLLSFWIFFNALFSDDDNLFLCAIPTEPEIF
jgi:hypothetical protein